MRATHHGRPGTQVIPEDWAARHRPTAEATMTTAEVDIFAPDGEGAFSRVTGSKAVIPGGILYTGKARIVRLNAQQQRQPVFEQTITVADYMVTIPLTNDVVTVDCRVRVTACDDTQLIGRDLTISGLLKGSHLWERDLFCIENTTRPHAA